ncbi:MAG: hypothetical protein PHW65_06500, partial [Dehalococcoidales bacterium]|nr:hypothetical protein [Dehalococcoidales bacterium]
HNGKPCNTMLLEVEEKRLAIEPKDLDVLQAIYRNMHPGKVLDEKIVKVKLKARCCNCGMEYQTKI